MRITTPQLYDNLLSGVRRQQEIQNDGNAKIASGTRFQRPSQAGLEYKTSLDFRHAQSGIQGSLDALSIAESRLSISQTLLNGMTNYLRRAQALAVQNSSAQVGAAERQAATQEVTHLVNQLLAAGNQKWQGQSLFAGAAVDKAAFVDDGSGNISYNGSAQSRIVAVNDTLQVSSNIRGDDPAFAAAFSAMKSFKTALQNNDVTAIQTSLGQLNSAGDGLVDLTSQVGANLNVVRISTTSFEDMKLNLEKQLSNHEAVDMPAIVAELQQSSIALQAAYSQIAQIKTLSLTNFLR
jgi:flagellin-like hook-associated protein FlgL